MNPERRPSRASPAPIHTKTAPFRHRASPNETRSNSGGAVANTPPHLSTNARTNRPHRSGLRPGLPRYRMVKKYSKNKKTKQNGWRAHLRIFWCGGLRLRPRTRSYSTWGHLDSAMTSQHTFEYLDVSSAAPRGQGREVDRWDR